MAVRAPAQLVPDHHWSHLRAYGAVSTVTPWRKRRHYRAYRHRSLAVPREPAAHRNVYPASPPLPTTAPTRNPTETPRTTTPRTPTLPPTRYPTPPPIPCILPPRHRPARHPPPRARASRASATHAPAPRPPAENPPWSGHPPLPQGEGRGEGRCAVLLPLATWWRGGRVMGQRRTTPGTIRAALACQQVRPPSPPLELAPGEG